MSMTRDEGPVRGRRGLTRRETLRGAIAGGVLLGGSGLVAACGGGSQQAAQSTAGTAPGAGRRGGTLRVGVTGGGAKDSLDAHAPTGDPDIARVFQLYEPLAIRNPDYRLEMVLAESIEAGRTADVWTIRLKPDLTFHDGRPVTAEDVIFTIQRIINPRDPKIGAASLSYVDIKAARKLDARTVRVPLKIPNAGFPDDLGQYFNGIVPTGYDPRRPVGTGAFRFVSFTPGERSEFARFDGYWREREPHVDAVAIIDFPDDTARVNALLGGQVDAITNLPAGQIAGVRGNPQIRVLISETGNWQPFTMRIDTGPFRDQRVRQAMRLLVDRQQMIQQVLSGHGRVANDLYSPFDPCYATGLAQRGPDPEQAKSLLRAAGQGDLRVQLTTAPVYQGIVEAAQVLAEQAKGAGVTINVRKVDAGAFYGDNYLKWPFAQDFWFTRPYLGQVAQGSLPNAPFNETHWDDPRFQRLIAQGRATLDESRRCEILQEAQRIEYERGGYIVWSFSDQIDAHSAKVVGFAPARTGAPLTNYGFRSVSFTD